jgi:predicted NAD/FAD-dependent oxidoreductase
MIEIFQTEALEILNQILGGAILDSWTWNSTQPRSSDRSSLKTLRPLPGMNALAKALPASLHVSKNQKVVKLAFDRSTQLWSATTSENQIFSARHVLCTFPIPQVLELLQQSQLELENPLPQEILNATYQSSISLLVIPDLVRPDLVRPDQLRYPTQFLRNPSPSIANVTENQWKGISRGTPCFTVSLTSTLSKELFQTSDEEILQRILPELQNELQLDPKQVQIHRWRYAQPQTIYPEPWLEVRLNNAPKNAALILSGDFFGDGNLSAFERGKFSVAELVNCWYDDDKCK